MGFMQAYSVDLRQRIVSALDEEGATIDSVAERFCVSPPSVKRYKRQLQQTGSLSPRPWPGRALKIKADQEDRLRELVAFRTDWTLQRLCEAWHTETGVSIPFGVMARPLARLKITYKKEPHRPGKRPTEAAGIPRSLRDNRSQRSGLHR
jgi:transposase